MALTVGTRLGPYEVLAPLGAGGMGEVYRARDTKLDRPVAIKILPESFAHDPERLARFEREAKTLASLNHPNIGAIYGLEESDDQQFLVLELVDGDTLAMRMARGPLPIEEALGIARQVAEALEAAHEKGIIHRDLKPANIASAAHDQVKVLDFGLAKLADPQGAASSDPSASPTITSPAMITGMGMILGTAAYMSPEQAKGQVADKRSDIWGFGAVLYEMLTGERAFKGTDVSETLAAVLRQDVDWTMLPDSTPPGVQWLLHRCFVRDPKARLRDIGEARIVLSSSAGAEPPQVQPLPRSRWKMAALVATAMLLAAIPTALLTTRLRPADTAPLRIGDVSDTTGARHAAIAPDGAAVAYSKPDGLWIRHLDRPSAVRIVTAPNIGSIAWSASSDTVAYFAGVDVRTIRSDGTAERTVWQRDAAGAFRTDVGLVWAGDALYVPTYGAITRVPVNGGDPAIAVAWDRTRSLVNYRHPLVLHQGRTLLVNPAVVGARFDFGTVWASGGNDLQQVLSFPQAEVVGLAYFAPAGELLISTRDDTQVSLWSVPFDVERVKAGTPQRLLEGQIASPPSNDGTIALLTGIGRQEWTLRWVGSDGREMSVVPQDRLDPRDLTLAPNGRHLAFRGITTEGEAFKLWVHDLERGVPQLVATLNYGTTGFASWSPDSSRLALVASSETPNSALSLQVVRVGQVQQPQILSQAVLAVSPTWTPDGGAVIFARRSGESTEIASVPNDASAPSAPLGRIPGLRSPGTLSLSPDGKLLAYEAGSTGRELIRLTTFPDFSAHIQVSREGARLPQWSPKGDEMWFVQGNELVAVPIHRSGSGDLVVGSMRTLLTPAPGSVLYGQIPGKSYATVDGRKFLLNTMSIRGEPRVTLVQNASELLRRARQ